jgi:hypothetical protein
MRKYIGFILVVTVFISCQKIKPQDNLQTNIPKSLKEKQKSVGFKLATHSRNFQ